MARPVPVDAPLFTVEGLYRMEDGAGERYELANGGLRRRIDRRPTRTNGDGTTARYRPGAKGLLKLRHAPDTQRVRPEDGQIEIRI